MTITPLLGHQYWLTIPPNSEIYEEFKHWNSDVTDTFITVQNIMLGTPKTKVEVIVSYGTYDDWALGLIVPASWLHLNRPNPTPAINFCSCPMDLLVSQGCKCGGV